MLRKDIIFMRNRVIRFFYTKSNSATYIGSISGKCVVYNVNYTLIKSKIICFKYVFL